MFKRIKRALVDSYVGAVALGYLFAQTIMYFIAIFSAPVSVWLAERRSPAFASHTVPSTNFILLSGIPQLIDAVLLLLLWYILLRWLYFETPRREKTVAAGNQGQPS
jgi:hypothetical protein